MAASRTAAAGIVRPACGHARYTRRVSTVESPRARPGTRLALFGGRSPATFLARYWQRRSLLVRSAWPAVDELAAFASRERLFTLALRDDVESRLVTRSRMRYELAHGPFRRRHLERLPPRDWTLLVSGVNLEDRAADRVLRRFAFLPWARLDDLMVSIAAPGGGVGPHVDSYDVFLLQADGRRRWRYGRQRDLTLRNGVPLKLLERFAPTHSETLAPGDLLYLPPGYAHDGVAVDTCVTCSIGFRAPLFQELAEAFLDDLRDRVALDGRYADPGLRPRSHPGEIDAAMRRQVAAALKRVRIDGAMIASFLGRWLTEPKPLIHFTVPPRTRRVDFAQRIARSGLALDLRTQMLYDRTTLYVNGEAMAMPQTDASTLRRLADRRGLAARACRDLAPATIALLHGWHRHGYLETTP